MADHEHIKSLRRKYGKNVTDHSGHEHDSSGKFTGPGGGGGGKKEGGGKAKSKRSQAVEIREEFRRLASSKFPSKAAELKEYIEEAEHQDGYGYWLEHGPADKLLKDFRIFLREIEGA